MVVCRVFDVVASPRVSGSRYPETVPRQSLFDVQQGRPSGAAKPTGVKFRIQTSFRAPQITRNCTDGLARRRGREVLESESMSAMRTRGRHSVRRDSSAHVSLVVTSRKPRRGKKKNSRAGIRLGYRDEYLSQTKSAAAQTVRPARRGRTGIFGTAARRAAPLTEAARVYRPAPDPKTRRSRRRPSCPWGGTS